MAINRKLIFYLVIDSCFSALSFIRSFSMAPYWRRVGCHKPALKTPLRHILWSYCQILAGWLDKLISMAIGKIIRANPERLQLLESESIMTILWKTLTF